MMEYEYPIYKEWRHSPGLVYKFIDIRKAICVQQEDNIHKRQPSIYIGWESESMVAHDEPEWKDIFFIEDGESSIYNLLKINDPNKENKHES